MPVLAMDLLSGFRCTEENVAIVEEWANNGGVMRRLNSELNKGDQLGRDRETRENLGCEYASNNNGMDVWARNGLELSQGGESPCGVERLMWNWKLEY
ncbi:hypothetical protein VNO78_33539 [Psophocarpus tetragonolobus]|uniref:Uncharacterized protein n=1 Tax=Psophocarpus tetragonolobus TaxID=3891 RepID=A0AAN9NX58_PSOTE